MARDYSAVNRIKSASHEVSHKDTPASLFMDDIELQLSKYYPIIDKLKSQKPNARIEVLKRCSLLGRLTLAPAFTIDEYRYGNTSKDNEKYIIHEVTDGWYLKDAIINSLREPYDESYEGRYATFNVAIGSDGRSWLGGISAFNAGEATFGVFGSGDLLQSFINSDPSRAGIMTPQNIISVNNRLSSLIIQDL